MRGCRGATHVHPGLVAAHIVDTVGNGLAARIVGDIMHQRRLGLVLWLPLAPRVLELAHQFLLLGVHREHGLLAL